MHIPGILLCIVFLALLGALLYADSRWRKWMKARRQERGANGDYAGPKRR